jgi:hypothetical protein
MDNKEVAIWVFGLTLLFMLLASPVACTMKRHQVIAEAIKNGADPIATKCAIEGDNGNSITCALIASRTKP